MKSYLKKRQSPLSKRVHIVDSQHIAYLSATLKPSAPGYGNVVCFENLSTRSLLRKLYENDPGFLRFTEDFPLKSHKKLRSAEIEHRCELYSRLAEHIRNPNRRLEAAAS